MPVLSNATVKRRYRGSTEILRTYRGAALIWQKAEVVSLLKLTDPTSEANHAHSGKTESALTMTATVPRCVTTWNLGLPVGTKVSFDIKSNQRVLVRYAPSGTVQLNAGDTYLDGTFANWTAREFTISATRAIFGFLTVVNTAVVEVRNFKAIAP